MLQWLLCEAFFLLYHCKYDVCSSTLAVVQKHQPGSNGGTGLFGELKRVFSELL